MSLRYEYVPPYAGSDVDHVGTYKRSLPVNLDRMYENALDWAHLPHLHAGSFQEIECVDAGAWGWRCRSVDKKGRESVLELALDRSCRRWITRNLEGPSKGAEIWTHVFVTGQRELDLVIDFFVPGVAEADREKVGRAYAAAYEVLYDEDVWMMTERQRQLDARIDSLDVTASVQIDLPDDESLPLDVVVSGRPFRLDRHQGEWFVYPATCPHQLGPLSAINEQGQVHCPWHGYVFDVQTGECVSGAGCQLAQRPAAAVTGDTITIAWST